MSNKRGPQARVKLDAEDFKQLADCSTLIVERNRLLDILKARVSDKLKPFNWNNTESTLTRRSNPQYQGRP